MQVKHFEDLEIWKEARCLIKEIYLLTSGSKFSKDFSLPSQNPKRCGIRHVEHC